MTFERSARGQSNRSIFYGVDFICYVEGEDQKSSGDDVYFWHIVFSALRPDLSVRYLSRGGKPELESLARDIVEKNISNQIVAMDCDYSIFFDDKIIEDHRVFYTFGYSWENDVFSPGVEDTAYCDVAKCPVLPQEAREHHADGWKALQPYFRRLVRADFYAFRCKGSVVDAQKPGRFIDRAPDGSPKPLRSNALTSIMAFNTSSRERAPCPCISSPGDEFRFIKGRLLSLAMRYLVHSSSSKFSGAKQVTDGHFKSVCLAIFRARLLEDADDPISEHHRVQVRRIAA